MPSLCRFCLTYGDPRKVPGHGSTIQDALGTDADLVEHIEMVHCIPVRRPGESAEQASKRVQEKNPAMGSSRCTCPDCVIRRRVFGQ